VAPLPRLPPLINAPSVVVEPASSYSCSISSSSSSEWPRHQKKMWRLEQRVERRFQNQEFKEQRRQLHQTWKQEKREEKKISKDKEYAARFVAHITIPDMSSIPKGERFTKIWRFRNEGSHMWPADARLVFVSKQMGDLMGAPDSIPIPYAVSPNQEVDLSVDFVAPPQKGQYCGYWRLCLPNGRKFGQRVWCRIHVID